MDFHAERPPKNRISSSSLSAGPCIYYLVQRRRIVYVGQTHSLLSRIEQHRAAGKMFDEVWWKEIPSSRLNQMEQRIINIIKPLLNHTHSLKERPSRPVPSHRSAWKKQYTLAWFVAAIFKVQTARNLLLEVASESQNFTSNRTSRKNYIVAACHKIANLISPVAWELENLAYKEFPECSLDDLYPQHEEPAQAGGLGG